MYPFIDEKKPFSGVPDTGYTYPGIPSGRSNMTKANAPDTQIGSGKKLAQGTYTANPFEQLFLQEKQRSQEEIEKEQRRLAARSTVNSLGMIVKTLANLYGASKGAIVNPIQDTVSPQISQELSVLKERKYNQERQQHTQKLQLALNEFSRTQDQNEYLNRFNLQQEAENRRDERNYGQQKEIIGLQDQLTDKRYSRELSDRQKLDERNFEQAKQLQRERAGLSIQQARQEADLTVETQKRLMDEGLKRNYTQEKPFYEVDGFEGKYNLTKGQYQDILSRYESDPKLKEEIMTVLDDADTKTKAGADQIVRQLADRFYEPTGNGGAKKKPKYDAQGLTKQLINIYDSQKITMPQAKRALIRKALIDNDPDEFSSWTNEEIEQAVDGYINQLEENKAKLDFVKFK
jgi:hypothetical protein